MASDQEGKQKIKPYFPDGPHAEKITEWCGETECQTWILISKDKKKDCLVYVESKEKSQ
jgi:hypothetical protein